MAIGAVAAASAVGTFPLTIFQRYEEQLNWLVYENEYQNGWGSRRTPADNPRRHYQVTFRLTPAEADDLREFFDDHGLTIPFYLLPLREGSQKVLRFAAGLAERTFMGGRIEISTELVEVS